MNLQIESFNGTKVVRVKEPRLIFPLLSDFSSHLLKMIEGGTREMVIDLSDVSYLDSASYGCLMDIYRSMSECNGTIKLVGLRERVEAMGNLIGLTRIIETFGEEVEALESFHEACAH
jgi:anti-anti-sigma factor